MILLQRAGWIFGGIAVGCLWTGRSLAADSSILRASVTTEIVARTIAVNPPPAELPITDRSPQLNLPSAEFKLLPDLSPVDLKSLEPGNSPPPGVITSHTVSPTHLTIPSFWWVAEQIANDGKYGNKFLLGWLAYPTQNGTPGRVDLVVNRQRWSLLDYLNRYEFVNRFSAIARGYGFNVRVFENQGELIAAFTCNYSGINASLLQTESPTASGDNSFTRDPAVDQLMCKTSVDSAALANYWELFKKP